MNIGIICYPTHGGSGVVATGIGHAMAERGHEVHVVSYAPPFRFRSFLPNMHYHEVEVSAYPLFRYPPYDLALAGKIMEVVESAGLDLIHVHYAIPNAISAEMARSMLGDQGAALKIITTLHGTDVTIVGQERNYHRITRYALEHSDMVTAVSRSLADETAALFGCLLPRVVYNFIDTELFRPGCCREKRRSVAQPQEQVVMHLSNFREVKRPLDIIEIFAAGTRGLEAKLVLLGEGPMIRDCKERAVKLGIGNRIVFAGMVNDPWEMLPQADVFLLPSAKESFGLAALEAMSCGVPVISTLAGGTPEVVEHGTTGFLHEVGDVQAMGASLRRLLEDKDMRTRMGQASRARAMDRFGKKLIVDEWEGLYREVVG